MMIYEQPGINGSAIIVIPIRGKFDIKRPEGCIFWKSSNNDKYYFYSMAYNYSKKEVILSPAIKQLLINTTQLILECWGIVQEVDPNMIYISEKRARFLSDMINCPIDEIKFDADSFRAMLSMYGM